MNMGEKIRARRLELGLTLEEVGNRVGVGKSTVRKWETGYIANMKRDKISLLAEALQVSPGYLMGWSTSHDLPPAKNILPIPGTRLVPLLGTIACGEPILAVENIEDNVPMPDGVRADFCLRCKGDSMTGALPRARRIYANAPAGEGRQGAQEAFATGPTACLAGVVCRGEHWHGHIQRKSE